MSSTSSRTAPSSLADPDRVAPRTRQTLSELLAPPPAQVGNGGKLIGAGTTLPTPETPLDRTTATARQLLAAEQDARAEKTARLRLDRLARDTGR